MGLLRAESAAISNWELINFFFPRSNSEKEVIWLTGMHIAKVWEDLFIRSGERLLRLSSFLDFYVSSTELLNLGLDCL